MVTNPSRKTIQIKEILKHQLPKLITQYRVKSLGLFGSYMRGEQKKGSDLDILVEFNETPSLFTFVELEDKLSQLLGIKVDLVMKKTLKPIIGKHILSEVTYVRNENL